MIPSLDLFWAKVQKTDTCWLWTGSKRKGYGQLRRFGKALRAHRVVWEMEFGPIPTGMDVCHKCDVRNCVNPSHLFVGTRADNMIDASIKGRLKGPHRRRTLYCPKGHLKDGDNLVIRIYRNGSRYPSYRCRICEREHSRKQKERNHETLQG